MQVVVGDWAARTVAEKQPVKLAAFEGLTETTKGAPFHLGGYYSESDREIKGGVPIPKLLSVLAFHDPNATVKGLDTVPVDDQPPVNIVRYSFLTMVTIGTALMALGGVVPGAVVAAPVAARVEVVLPRAVGGGAAGRGGADLPAG